MTRKRSPQEEGPGQDSFLDIVANLVWILIILVIVVGVRAKEAMIDAEQATGRREELAAPDASTPILASKALISEINQIQANIQRSEGEIEFRRRERDKFLQYIRRAELHIDEKKKALSADDKAKFEMQSELSAVKTELHQLQQTQAALANAMKETKVIEHIPTPLAKTVFGREIHYRLEKDHIVLVPWDALIDKLKSKIQREMQRLRQTPEVNGVIGPIQDFRMQYTLKRKTYAARTSGGQMLQTRGELDHFLIIPMRDELGESVEDALKPRSEFYELSKALDPNRITITVWVYPDSYASYRKVRAFLAKRGFVVAGRPMPPDFPIGGSPSGTRSAAQ